MSTLTEEITYTFSEMPEQKQKFVLISHFIAMELRSTKQMDILKRIFSLGNPKIVFGINGEKPYCRIAKESVEVMQLLIRNYL